MENIILKIVLLVVMLLQSLLVNYMFYASPFLAGGRMSYPSQASDLKEIFLARFSQELLDRNSTESIRILPKSAPRSIFKDL